MSHSNFNPNPTVFDIYNTEVGMNNVVQRLDYEHKLRFEPTVSFQLAFNRFHMGNILNQPCFSVEIIDKSVILGRGFFEAVIEILNERFRTQDLRDCILTIEIKNSPEIKITEDAFKLSDANYEVYIRVFSKLNIHFSNCVFDRRYRLASNLFSYLPNLSCKFSYCTGLILPPVTYDAENDEYSGGIAIGSGEYFSIIRCDISEIPRYTLNQIDCKEITISGCTQLTSLPADIFVGLKYTEKFDFSHNMLTELPYSICWPSDADPEVNDREMGKVEVDDIHFDFKHNAITFADGTFENSLSDMYKLVRMKLYAAACGFEKTIDVESRAMHPAAKKFLGQMNYYFYENIIVEGRDLAEAVEREGWMSDIDDDSEEDEEGSNGEEFDWMSDLDAEEGSMLRL